MRFSRSSRSRSSAAFPSAIGISTDCGDAAEGVIFCSALNKKACASFELPLSAGVEDEEGVLLSVWECSLPICSSSSIMSSSSAESHAEDLRFDFDVATGGSLGGLDGFSWTGFRE
eukprot:TRINITY_DN1324_c0_g1_i4.p1 TRINITY_DN1324_c0_g1~~TRINITY_DN1324_c0_g1_i4.p1  ORF type:complete len:116 (+),score=7.36 TRINITY_DN1324_c0_g1_i4:413-760(+)